MVVVSIGIVIVVTMIASSSACTVYPLERLIAARFRGDVSQVNRGVMR